MEQEPIQISPELYQKAVEGWRSMIATLYDMGEDYVALALDTPAGWESFNVGFFDRYLGFPQRDHPSDFYAMGWSQGERLGQTTQDDSVTPVSTEEQPEDDNPDDEPKGSFLRPPREY